MPSWPTITAHRADENCVDSQLRTMPQRQPIGNHLNLTCVSDWHINVHVCQEYIPSNARARLSADPRRGVLQRHTARAQDTSSGACSSVIPIRVHAAPTTAPRQASRQLHTEPSQQKHTEVRIREGELLLRWQDSEGTSSLRAGLRQ